MGSPSAAAVTPPPCTQHGSRCPSSPWCSVAAAGLHHHVAVLLEDHVVVAVVVEDGGGTELGGRAARLGHGLGLHQVHLRGRGVVGMGEASKHPGS